MDTIVFDIETQNFFTDPDVGWNNFGALKISVVCLYSYAQNTYLCFEEDQIKDMAQLFKGNVRLVGFSSNRYDVPVLHHYFQKLREPDLDLWEKERVDLLEEIEMATGERISLSKLAEANLGIAKDRHGREAIALYQQGAMDELKAYCRKDVEITKALYDIYREKHFFLIPQRVTGEIKKVSFPLRLGI